ncbi:MAG: methylated-DNA--[protein]-cysteine S-methyltransferase [Verrucomicrobium sp.]|nr:methylated-DNA--[protein]-cysteine S-methyltransferase [Verrucomicrobium sp.]
MTKKPPLPQTATRHAAAVARACRLLEAAAEAPSLDALARAAGMSRHHFHRAFKAATGLTPKAYASARRAEKVRAALPRGRTVTEGFHEAGFGSSGRFYAEAARELGMPPRAYRKGGAGAEVRFAVAATTLGALLVAASEKGLCMISLGDDPAVLVRELEERFPRARLAGADREFEKWVARVVGCVEAPGLEIGLPLDLRGTVFQKRVWQALRRIPAGTTATYAAIARKIGAPRAVRAVAGACAANVLALAVPCHRVVRTDGGLSGYRWTAERKRILLEREARS